MIGLVPSTNADPSYEISVGLTRQSRQTPYFNEELTDNVTTRGKADVTRMGGKTA
jgi:hypothetical protein